MRSSNPVFRSLERSESYEGVEAASYRGIVSKTATLLITAVMTGYLAITYIPLESLYSLLFGSMIVAFISVLVASFSPRLAMPFALLYALSEGVLLGVITLMIEMYFPGVAIAAVIGTASIFTVMLFLYSSRTIRVTSRFRRIMYSILLAFLVFFIIFGILGLFGSVTFNAPIALGVTGILIIFGALMLALDFDRAERVVEGGADKTYEWVVAVGLMVTVVWIYIELLRFLAILASRRN
ncbi:MAG: Bax inhibitor-1/YccA family protein [Acholeplasmataceae bacterium]|nr:Bax inhibitor-1/YccA family protein [Acholeplasmataceae bacterium]